MKASNLKRFADRLERNLGTRFNDYEFLHAWSCEAPDVFWAQIWQFTEIRASRQWDAVLSDADQFPGARWFEGARLNFAENLLRHRSDKLALIARLENGARKSLTYNELFDQVSECAAGLRQLGVVSGDRSPWHAT